MDKIIINGHEAVDLGLSVKWATCNVGASSPEEFGDYFAWGETESKAVFSAHNHRFYDPTPYSYALAPTPIGLYYRKGYYRKRYKDGVDISYTQFQAQKTMMLLVSNGGKLAYAFVFRIS